ncbi:MAG: TauD/TfdA family dioxygenase [Nitratireductor sp.]
MQILPLTGGLGAEIVGADMGCLAVRSDRDALHHVPSSCCRGQTLTPEDHLEFARRWGRSASTFFKALDSHPEIALVVKERDQKGAVGEEWHTDHAYDQEPVTGARSCACNRDHPMVVTRRLLHGSRL